MVQASQRLGEPREGSIPWILYVPVIHQSQLHGGLEIVVKGVIVVDLELMLEFPERITKDMNHGADIVSRSRVVLRIAVGMVSIRDEDGEVSSLP